MPEIPPPDIPDPDPVPPLPAEGGLRDRFVFESYAAHIKDGLTALGWFQPGRQHKPLVWRTTAFDSDEEIQPNSVVVTFEDIDTTDAELGSNATEDSISGWADVYAENDALGIQLSGDIRDILRGKMPSIGKDSQGFPILDPREDPPVSIGWCDVEDVTRVRDNSQGRGPKRHWYAISCLVIEARA